LDKIQRQQKGVNQMNFISGGLSGCGVCVAAILALLIETVLLLLKILQIISWPWLFVLPPLFVLTVIVVLFICSDGDKS